MRKKLLLGAAFAAILGAVAWAQSPGVNSPFVPVWSIPLDSIKRTYSVGFQLSPATTATDIMQICGNAQNTVKVTRIAIAGRATAVSPMDLFLLRRSGQDTNSSNAVSPTAAQADYSDAGPQSFVNFYWTNPTTLATLVAVLGTFQTYLGNLTTGTTGSQWAFDFGNRPAKAPTLRGASQCLVVNLSGTSSSGNLTDLMVEWTEE